MQKVPQPLTRACPSVDTICERGRGGRSADMLLGRAVGSSQAPCQQGEAVLSSQPNHQPPGPVSGCSPSPQPAAQAVGSDLPGHPRAGGYERVPDYRLLPLLPSADRPTIRVLVVTGKRSLPPLPLPHTWWQTHSHRLPEWMDLPSRPGRSPASSRCDERDLPGFHIAVPDSRLGVQATR